MASFIASVRVKFDRCARNARSVDSWDWRAAFNAQAQSASLWHALSESAVGFFVKCAWSASNGR